MTRTSPSSIPDPLRKRLEQEPAGERDALTRVWHMVEGAEAQYDDAPPAEETWKAIQPRINGDAAGDATRSARPPQPRRARRRWSAIAAGVFLLMLAGAFFWKQPVDVVAPPGERVTATLPDGSTVELNSSTTLSHARRFHSWPFWPSAQRVVRLQGEAYFNVAPGARPFVVETFNARVEVRGTQFNVRARTEDNASETRVTLAEGRVRVSTPEHPGNAVTLTHAGQSSRVTQTGRRPSPPEAIDVERALAWRQQGFAVSDWPLAAIFAELERRYNLRITTRAPAVLTDSMTLYYPRHTEAKTIIHDIAVAKGLSYRATSRGFEITDQ